MNKLTIITYRVKLRKQEIELINIPRGQAKAIKVGSSSYLKITFVVEGGLARVLTNSYLLITGTR